ncbi:hypothetical protein BGX27_005583 [Mortierella sp. AM989]|nr:hypothetical protein BGX27_005583 [Mortierella sp. AM989]
MSKNPYFAHLPTWRNRQDLAYALDNLPRILETMTASSPLIATYSYPSTSNSLSQSASPLSSSASSTTSTSSSVTSTYGLPAATSSSSSPQSHYGALPSHTTASGIASPATFRERFMLDLAKECQKSQFRTPQSSAQSTPCVSRRVSSSSHHSQSASTTNTSSSGNSISNGNGNPFYPLQFSTRAKAMAYLIEILQSLQKEPCSCDLTKGCYCGVDGIEDHEGKSPCYVCGEWFSDRRDNTHGEQVQTQGQEQGQGQGQHGQRQGRAWHEQGSLRHHVAESRVKKWLDSVFRPPLAPATSPEQENLRQFGSISQEDLLLRQERQYQYHQPAPNPVMWNHQPLNHQHQGQQQLMEPGRPWSFHDIELEARSKSRSRQNSSSSNGSSSWSSYSYSSSQQTQQYHQDMPGSGYNYGPSTGSNTWKFTVSPKPLHATPPSPPMQLSLQSCTPSPSFSPAPHFTSMRAPTVSCQPRARTLSCTDSQHGRIFSASSLPFTPPTDRPSSCNSNRGSTPIRSSSTHSTTFAIPQEILDPNYKSPTFRIKSWNPPSSNPSAPVSLQAQVLQPRLERTSQPKKQAFDDWSAGVQQDAVKKSSFLRSSVGQQEVNERYDLMAPVPAVEQQRNMREVASSCEVTPTKKVSNAPFRFSFTSQRFRAAVEASVEKTAAVDTSPPASALVENVHKDETDQFSVSAVATANSILQSALCPELEEDGEPLTNQTTLFQSGIVTAGVKITIIASSNSSTPKSTGFQGVPFTATLGKEASGHDNDNNAVDAAASLVSKLTEITLVGSTSPELGSKDYHPEIRKTAPMSPLHSSVSSNDFANALSPPSTCSSPRFSTTPTSPMSPTGAGGNDGGGVNKATSWTSLHRLVRKMTRNNNTVMASLPRGGIMHLEGS